MARVALEAKPLVDHPSIGTCVRARRVVGPSGDIEDGDGVLVNIVESRWSTKDKPQYLFYLRDDPFPWDCVLRHRDHV
jgi:hypothetical protein